MNCCVETLTKGREEGRPLEERETKKILFKGKKWNLKTGRKWLEKHHYDNGLPWEKTSAFPLLT